MTSKTKSWEVSDKFWSFVKPLIPKPKRDKDKKYKRKKGGGRKPLNYRNVFSGIVYVLRTGCQWNAVPKEFGSPTSIYTYFRKWEKEGFFLKLWVAGLAEYDEMEGIAWEWQSIDGSNIKAPMAKETVGKNPTDRGKKWEQEKFTSRRKWRPVVNRRMRSKQT